MIARGRRHTPTDHPEPQQRDLEILRALWRYRYLTTGMIADNWWPGCHLTRAQVRLRRLHEAGWIGRLRPRLDRGSHEWIYHLARPGFLLGQRYLRTRHELFIPHEAKWRQGDAVDLDYVWHDLEVNRWMGAYKQLLGDQLEDWLGPMEARTKIGTRFDSGLRRHTPPTADQLAPSDGWVRDLRSGEEVRPVYPDAAAVLRTDEEHLPAEVLIEYDRTGRPAKNIEKLRRYDTLLCCGWRAVDRLRRQAPKGAVQPWLVVVFVCAPGTLRSFMRAADSELTGTLGFYMRPGVELHPGRAATLFCEANDVPAGSMRAFRLPDTPPERRDAIGFDPREVLLPGYRATAFRMGAQLNALSEREPVSASKGQTALRSSRVDRHLPWDI